MGVLHSLWQVTKEIHLWKTLQNTFLEEINSMYMYRASDILRGNRAAKFRWISEIQKNTQNTYLVASEVIVHPY